MHGVVYLTESKFPVKASCFPANNPHLLSNVTQRKEMEKAYKIALAQLQAGKNSTQNMC